MVRLDPKQLLHGPPGQRPIDNVIAVRSFRKWCGEHRSLLVYSLDRLARRSMKCGHNRRPHERNRLKRRGERQVAERDLAHDVRYASLNHLPLEDLQQGGW